METRPGYVHIFDQAMRKAQLDNGLMPGASIPPPGRLYVGGDFNQAPRVATYWPRLLSRFSLVEIPLPSPTFLLLMALPHI